MRHNFQGRKYTYKIYYRDWGVENAWFSVEPTERRARAAFWKWFRGTFPIQRAGKPRIVSVRPVNEDGW